MDSKLVPLNPEAVMVMRKITPDILICSVPFKRFGLINVGGRGTIVRMQNGSLAVFSPVALTDAVRNSVREMGEVKYITALDNEHHIFLDPWHKEFPSAKILGPEELAPKRKKQGKELPFAYLFKESEPSPRPTGIDEDFDREFECEYAYGHANKEVVVLHRPSKTMIQADFLWNLPAHEQMSKSGESGTHGFLTRMFAAIQTTSGSAIWQKRLLWYAIAAQNRDAFNKSCARIDAWDFDRIIPCHGDVIETGGKGIFRKVMEWHLNAAKKQQ